MDDREVRLPPHFGTQGDHVDDEGRPWQISITWTPIDGRYEPDQVAIRALRTGTPVSASVIRRLPIGSAIAEQRKTALASLKAAHEQLDSQDLPLQLLALGKERSLELLDHEAHLFGSRRGVALSDDALREVAEVYRRARHNGVPVTRAVAEAFGIAPSTAAKRIMAARTRGFLGAAPGPRGGEKQGNK